MSSLSSILSSTRTWRFCFLLWSCFFIYSGVVCFWASEEMRAVAISGDLFDEPQSFYQLQGQAFFYFVLYLIREISVSLGIFPMDMARLVFALNGIFIVTLVYRLVAQQTKRTTLGLVAAAALMFSIVFLKRGYRIRAEYLVVTLQLLWFLIYLSKSWTFEKKIPWLIFIPFLALLSSPISLIFMAPTLFWVVYKIINDTVGSVRIKWLTVLIASIVMVLIAWSPFFLDLVREVQTDGFRIYNFSSKRVYYLQSFLTENWLAFYGFVILLGIYVYIRSYKLTDPLANQIVITYSVWLLVILLILPEPTPWLIASMFPFWIVAGAIAIEMINGANLKHRIWSRRVQWILIVFIGIYLVQYFIATQELHFQHNNKSQRKVSKALNAFFEEHPDLTVYDPSGVVPQRSAYRFGFGENMRLDQRNKDFLIANKPDVVLLTPRIRSIHRWMIKYFMAYNYRDHGGGLWIRPIKISVEDRAERIMIPEILKIVENYCNCKRRDELMISFEAFDNTDLKNLYLKRTPESILEKIESGDRISLGQLYGYTELRFGKDTTHLELHVFDSPFFEKDQLIRDFHDDSNY